MGDGGTYSLLKTKGPEREWAGRTPFMRQQTLSDSRERDVRTEEQLSSSRCVKECVCACSSRWHQSETVPLSGYPGAKKEGMLAEGRQGSRKNVKRTKKGIYKEPDCQSPEGDGFGEQDQCSGESPRERTPGQAQDKFKDHSALAIVNRHS